MARVGYQGPQLKLTIAHIVLSTFVLSGVLLNIFNLKLD